MKALITGISGMDGSYLADHLLGLGYEVVGMVRRRTDAKLANIAHIADRVTLVEGDMTDQTSLIKVVEKAAPDEVYNLAAQSFVPLSWEQPELTAQVTGLGALRLLEAIKIINRKIRYFQASSSEMFGNADHSPQDEATPRRPRSPYGIAKVFAHDMTVNYRESYDMFAVCGISFNHEGERRGPEFVTQKIALAAKERKPVALGNLEAKRDWGYAPDYVRAFRMMLQAPEPRDYVIATGETHTVGEFAKLAYAAAGLDSAEYVTVDPKFFRPAELHALCGDASRIRADLGWSPEVPFEELVRRMVAGRNAVPETATASAVIGAAR